MLVGANLSGRGDLDYIDTSAYRFEAVVDYYSFRIETARPTQFRYIQEHLAERIGSTPHVRPIDPDTGKQKTDEGGTTNVFELKVYDEIANNAQALTDLFDHLAAKFPLVGVPQVTGLEIAFDAYSRRNSRDDLVKATQWFMEHLSATGDNVRQFDPAIGSKGVNLLIEKESDRRPLDPELNLRIGNQGAGLSFQVYLKETDKAGTVKLDLENSRARAEFTLLGDALAAEGLRSVDDLASFDLARLAKRLRFANLMPLNEVTAGMDAIRAVSVRAVWDERAVCLAPGWSRRDTGSDGYRRHTITRPRKSSRYTRTNKGMNERVSDEFGKLAARYLTKKRSENDQTTTPTPPEPA